jgi:hypothetical protein
VWQGQEYYPKVGEKCHPPLFARLAEDTIVISMNLAPGRTIRVEAIWVYDDSERAASRGGYFVARTCTMW